MTCLSFRTAADWRRETPVAREHLSNGGVVAHPTETVYGLGTRVTEEGARLLADLKGRNPPQPLILLVSSYDMAAQLDLTFTPAAEALARVHWPGPLTLVLSGGGRVPAAIRGPRGVAVRLTGHPGVRHLIESLGEPMTSTSANRSGDPPTDTAQQLGTAFGPAIATGNVLVLDGGQCQARQPSTVVDCTQPKAILLREGALPWAALRVAMRSPGP